MNLPAGLVFYLDFQYGNTKPPFTSGDSVYGTPSANFGNLAQGALYGAGRFGYSLNQFSASVVILSSSVNIPAATFAEVDFNSAFSSSIVAGEIKKLSVPTSSLSGSLNIDGVRAFTIASGALAVADTLQQFTKLNGANVDFFVTASTAEFAATSSLTVYYNKATDFNSRGDFEDRSGLPSVPNSLSATSIVIPEINVQMKSQTISAKTRKLKAQWTPEYGYWKDVFSVLTPNKTVLDWMSEQLNNPNSGLLAKWFPRRGVWFSSMHKHLGLTPKEFRKMIVEKTKVVETTMCNKEWDAIEYSKIPSQAFQKYKRAFLRNDEYRFNDFISAVVKGNAKVNSGTLFPYQLYQSYTRGLDKNSVLAQWINLPDYVGEGSFLPVCDVSGSMMGLPMEISVSLGVYLSERNKSAFKDAFITFSESPRLQYLKGNVVERFSQLANADWGMSTNLQSVFDLVLNKAIENRLAQSDLPETILIISKSLFKSNHSFHNKHLQPFGLKHSHHQVVQDVLPNTFLISQQLDNHHIFLNLQ